MVTVAVVGAGSVGRALGEGLASAGRDVLFGVRNPADTRYADLASARPLTEVALLAHVVVLAVPAAAAASTVDALGLQAGQILVDATNAVRMAVPDGFETMGDLVASHAPAGVAVVKAFNTLGAEHMRTGTVGGAPAFLPIAGDPAGVDHVAELARSIGFEVVVLGGRDCFALLEHHARLWIHLAFSCGWGRDFAFGVLRS